MRRLLIVLLIALAAWGVAVLPAVVPPLRGVVDYANEFFYDSYYRTRPVTDMTGGSGNVVIVTANERSIEAVGTALGYGWPWPREVWGNIAGYADAAGARAIVFDLVFLDPSVYNNATGDDETFAGQIAALKGPVVFGAPVLPDGTWNRFAPPVPAPTFGAVNLGDVKTYRRYPPTVFGKPSLAKATTATARATAPLAATAPTTTAATATRDDDPFLLHFYGPHKTAAGANTFRYVSAADVLIAVMQPEKATISPEVFKDKIVLLGTTATGTYDLKSSPLSDVYPGVEVHATAVENLLADQFVGPVGRPTEFAVALLGTLVTAVGVALPRRATVKLAVPVVVAFALLGVGVGLFRGRAITWLPPVVPLGAVVLAGLGAFAWSYFAEDKQRRFMLRALSKVVSPRVAEELSANPERLTLGAQRREMTVMFTDLAGFTDLSETMDAEALARVLNRYLGEMSDCVLAHNGTLDKYIGDAIMSFWNAPLDQPDHAALACRAALAIAKREGELLDELQAMGAGRIFTRIGVNTGPMAVGFTGSSHLMNYTVLGDSVNLGSRLEGANKLYGTRILLSEPTAQLVRDRFVLRKVDVLRVKGKRQPMAVYELVAERAAGDGATPAWVARYETAFAHYQKQRWDDAEAALVEMAREFGEDAASRALLKRIGALRVAPPPADWDGVYDAKDK